MAGHSKFKNIMHRKGAQDAKRSRLFTRHFRAISVAARIDSNPDTNFSLRSAILAARADNVPKDRINRAIQGASNTDQSELICYEGFAAGGVALLVEMLTDNRRRTASAVRRIFDQHNGHLGEPGEVQFLFSRKGMAEYPAEVAAQDAMLTCAAEQGAQDYFFFNGKHVLLFNPEDFHKNLSELEKTFGPPLRTCLIWQPETLAQDASSESVLKLMEKLAENEDFQRVYCNHPDYLQLQQQLEEE